MNKELIPYLTVGLVIGFLLGLYSEQVGIGLLLGAILGVLVAIYNQLSKNTKS